MTIALTIDYTSSLAKLAKNTLPSVLVFSMLLDWLAFVSVIFLGVPDSARRLYVWQPWFKPLYFGQLACGQFISCSNTQGVIQYYSILIGQWLPTGKKTGWIKVVSKPFQQQKWYVMTLKNWLDLQNHQRKAIFYLNLNPMTVTFFLLISLWIHLSWQLNQM